MANEQNPYGPAQLQGPFTDAINPNVVSQPHQSPLQFNGYDTKTGAILGIASKVLAGIGQGRAQRALSKEKEQATKLQNYTATAQWIMANPDIDPAQKAKFGQDFQAALLPMVAGAAKDSGADKHPVGGAFLNILKGVAGGDIKSPKYDFKGIDTVMANYAHLGKTPDTTVSGQQNAAISGLQQAIKQTATQIEKRGQRATPEEIVRNLPPQVQQPFARFMSPDKVPGYVDSVVKTMYREGPADQAPPRPGSKEAAIENYNKQFGPGTPPPAASAPQGAPPQASIPPAPSVVDDSLISPEMRKHWEGTVTPPYTATGNINGPGSLKTRSFRDSPAAAPPPASSQPVYMAPGNITGLVKPGNIDLSNRPVVKNPDGTQSTVSTITIEEDGKGVLLPTIIDGKRVSEDEAIKHYEKTGEHMGIFKSEKDADEYDKKLHNDMGWNGKPGGNQAAWQGSQPPAPQTMSVAQWTSAQAAGYLKEPVTKMVDGKPTNVRFSDAPGASGWYTTSGKRIENQDGVTDLNIPVSQPPKQRVVDDGKGKPVIEIWDAATKDWKQDTHGGQPVRPWERATKSQKDQMAPARAEVVRAASQYKETVDRINQAELKSIQDIRKAKKADGSPQYSDAEQAQRIKEVQNNYENERVNTKARTNQLIDIIGATNNIVSGALLDHDQRTQLGLMPHDEGDEDKVMGDPNQF